MKQEDKKAILDKYVTLNEQIKVLEAELKLLKKVVKEDVGTEVEGFEITINEIERESFSLKDARENLSKDLLRKLAKFIKTTTYETLSVKRAWAILNKIYWMI